MWGQQVVVLNHPGAGGGIAARTAAQAAPDGYTLYMPASSAFVALPGLQANLPLDLPRDFVPIGFVAAQPFMLAVVSSWHGLPQLRRRGLSAPLLGSISIPTRKNCLVERTNRLAVGMDRSAKTVWGVMQRASA